MLIRSKNTGKRYCLVLCAMLLGACSDNDTSSQTTAHANDSNVDREYVLTQGHETAERSKRTLMSAFKAASQKDFDGFMAAAADPYIQHSPDFEDGWKPVWDLLINRPEGFSSKTMQWMGKGGFLDSGDFLVMLRKVDRADGSPPSKIVDIMRFDDKGLYAEHWDIKQALSASTASGRDELSAADEFANNPVNYDEATEQKNALLVVNFLNKAFNQGRLTEALDEMAHQGYVQHNPLIADGIDAVKKVFADGLIPALSYDIKYVLPQNDLVVVYSKVTSEKGISAVVDIVRVRDGKLVEHWDVIEAVPPEDQIPHKNGMF